MTVAGALLVTAVVAGRACQVLKCGAWPTLPCVLVSSSTCKSNSGDEIDKLDEDRILQAAAVIDFGQGLVGWKDRALAYLDMSPNGDAEHACRVVQSTLEWAQQVPGAKMILVPIDLPSDKKSEMYIHAIQTRFRAEASETKPVERLDEIPKLLKLPSLDKEQNKKNIFSKLSQEFEKLSPKNS